MPPPNPATDPLPLLQPSIPHPPSPPPSEPPQTQSIITALRMKPHAEGGYFAEAFRDARLVPSPFPEEPAVADHQLQQRQASPTTSPPPPRPGFDPRFRNASTTIFYLLTPISPRGFFHRNRGHTLHTLHRGRGQYVVLHPAPSRPRRRRGDDDDDGKEKDGEKEDDEGGGGARIETFVVGRDAARGERQRWLVEGGTYKAAFLLPDREASEETGLLVSETVMPGFEFFDHEFLTRNRLEGLVGRERARELEWLVKRVGEGR